MDFITLLLLAVALSMDAFAVSICKGLAMKKIELSKAIIIGLWFGVFQALMPLAGYFLGNIFEHVVTNVAPYIAFALLVIIGANMIREAINPRDEKADGSVQWKGMLILAVATSIDAFAAGISLGVMNVNLAGAVGFIGITTFVLSVVGVVVGVIFGSKYERKAEIAGGVILILIGLKSLLEHFVTVPDGIYLQFLLLLIGFVLLIKGADVFVDAASKTATKLGIPQIVIGLTIVAFGTSAPEAAISITAAVQGSSGLAVGNILGSNILNVLIILGISACLTPLAIQKTTFKYEIPFVFVISIVLMLLGMNDNVIGRIDGAILWIFMIAFLVYLVVITKKGLVESEETEELSPKDKTWKLILFLILGGVCIVVGSNFTVDAATSIATTFGMSERLIGLTIIAFGTSLPELITSVTAASKHKADIAVGNIVGSNIFNILFVLGSAALIAPTAYVQASIVDNIVAAVAMIMLFVFVLKDKKLHRAGGIIMLISYAVYFVYLLLM